ncbi:MAG: NUDIX hydrolase [Symbiobacteriaceae bacterium]|nr:NUDIX hydrolase [Symbiobacteriaceae bacterium]
MDTLPFRIRVTGIVIVDEKILLVKQRVTEDRGWSLPGGRVEQGETLESALVREIREETGLVTKVTKLLYICDMPYAYPSTLHITFLADYLYGTIALPSSEFDENPISDVQFVLISNLDQYGFSQEFCDRVKSNFPDAGNYMGIKANIGL